MIALRRRVIGFIPKLELSTNSVSLNENGTAVTVTVTSNTTWDVN